MSKVKILHTSDWHLGKKLFKYDRQAEHEYFLNWLTQTIIQKEIDVLLIAGDIFDTPNPPHESIKLWFQSIQNILEKTNADIIVISGNHDSGIFLESPTPILDQGRVQIIGTLRPKWEDHFIKVDKKGIKLNFTLFPYFRNFEIEKWKKSNDLQFKDLDDKEGETLKLIETFFNSNPNKDADYNILCSHHLFGHFEESTSEHAITLSGLSSIPTKLLQSFDYVALGHIHKYQKIYSEPPTYYCGSPIAFRFSETFEKFVNIIEFDKKELIQVEKVSIPKVRELMRLKADQSTLKKDLKLFKQNFKKIGELDTFLEVIVSINEPMTGLADIIREELNDLPLQIISITPRFNTDNSKEEKSIVEQDISLDHLFDNFYKYKFSTDSVDSSVKDEFNQLLEQITQLKQEEGDL